MKSLLECQIMWGLTSPLRKKKKTRSEAELCQSQENQSYAVFNMHEIIRSRQELHDHILSRMFST